MLGLPVETGHQLDVVSLSDTLCPSRIDVGCIVMLGLDFLFEAVDRTRVGNLHHLSRIARILGIGRTVHVPVLIESICKVGPDLQRSQRLYGKFCGGGQVVLVILVLVVRIVQNGKKSVHHVIIVGK